MSRWIDSEWLMNFFTDIPDNFTLTIGNLRATVNEAPSIDIVRCEECKHKEKCTMVAHHLTVGKGIKFVPVTYCSAGERQTERNE